MIQIKRGKTKNWRSSKIKLASGQPGYDKDKHKLKIGDGETSWQDLPYASGLSAKEILDSESSAKVKNKADSEDKTIFTYGTDLPTNDTVGQVYLQYSEVDPEVDYVIKAGIDGIWTYQQWKSGIAKCWGTLKLTANIQTSIESVSLFYDNSMTAVSYPFTFKEIPAETVTLQSSNGIIWLAGKKKNTKNKSGTYTLLSVDEQASNANYYISLHVEGFWK